MIFIIDDDQMMAECVKKACQKAISTTIKTFSSGITAMSALAEELPKLIFLDVLLDGPDGFTFLNELESYVDSAQIPVVLISSIDLTKHDLSHYGVVAVLDKSTMTPADITNLTNKHYERKPTK